MQSLWTLLHSERKYSDRLISVDRDLYRLEESGMTGDFTIIRTFDWINVIPVTAEGNFVFIRQFRHGIREEETGFVTGRWEDLGFVTPNPALQNNRCHTFLAIGATRAFAPEFDAYERIETVLLSRREAAGALRDGTVHHGLVLAAFGRYFAAGYDLR
jgi:hypothetical protein